MGKEEQSRYGFDHLEYWIRGKIQYWVQELLEYEVSGLVGRSRYERRGEIAAPSGYRNGYGKERRVTLSCGTIRVRRPRMRDWKERFESRVPCRGCRRSGTASWRSSRADPRMS